MSIIKGEEDSMYGIYCNTASLSRTEICFTEVSKKHSSNSHFLLKNTRREAGAHLCLQDFFRKCVGPPQLGGVKWLYYQKSAAVMEPQISLAVDRLLKLQELQREDNSFSDLVLWVLCWKWGSCCWVVYVFHARQPNQV